jgi:hypothetical protein
VRAAAVAIFAALALAAPAAAASDEPICHGQLAPRTPELEKQFLIEWAMEQRAENGLRADETYVRELDRRGLPDSKWIVGPVTSAEERYLRLRYRLGLGPGRRGQRYLDHHRDLYGGGAIVDRFPRKPLLVVYLTRNRAVHAARLRQLVRYPKLLRTARAEYSQRTLQRIEHRINYRDNARLRRRGFDITSARVAPPDRVVVPLITPRTDYAEYFKRRYGPLVKVEVKGTELTELVCVQANWYEVVGDRELIVHWIPQDSYAQRERIEAAEFDDRVELGVVERQPTANDTDGAGPDHFKLRVTLSRPLGTRAVIDAADRAPLRQFGAAPGAPPCPPDGLEEEIARRTLLGLPADPEHVKRLLVRGDLFTRAESRWLDRFDGLEYKPAIQEYVRSQAEYGDAEVVGRFPHKPHLVVWFTGHLRRHQRHLGPAVEVRRAPLTFLELLYLSQRIGEQADAAGNVLDGFGDTAFYFNDTWIYGGRVLIWLRTQRTDAASYFRERYGPATRVLVESRRWECGQVRW